MSTEISAMEDLKCYSLNWIEDNIVRCDFHKDIVVDHEEAVEITTAIIAFTNNQPFKIIIDLQNVVWTITTAGRETFSSDPEYNQLRKKSAFVVNSLPVRLLVNFYQKINLKHQNTKTFSSIEESLDWIKKD